MTPRRAARVLLAAASFVAFSCGGKTPSPPSRDAAEGTPGPATPAAREIAEPAELPPGHPPLGQPPLPEVAIPPPAAGSGTGDAGMSWTAPDGWVSEPPSRPTRRAQYRVPGPGGEAECIVFYFGPGKGGDPTSNAERWASQFSSPDGAPGPGRTKTSELTLGDVQVLFVEVAGTYSSAASMGAASEPGKPGYMLLGAIAEGPDANWFFKLTGPEKTVDAQRGAFETMVRSLRKGA